MSIQALYGTVEIPGIRRVLLDTIPQDADPLRQGHSGRNDRQGVRQFALTSWHQGLGVIRGFETAHSLRLSDSQGLVSLHENGLFLPYLTEKQSSLTATDISGLNAANLRVSQVSTTLGQNKLREYFFLGKKTYRTVSDADDALEDAALNPTDNWVHAFQGRINDTDVIIAITDGTTDDIGYIADPTASPPVLTALAALTAGDRVDGGWYMRTMGPKGFNFFVGKYGGTVGLWYLPTDVAALTALSPLVDAASKDIEGSLATITEADASPANGSTDPVSSGLAWSNPGNILSSNNSDADTPQNAAGTTDRLIASDFDFSAVPLGNIVTGIRVLIEGDEDSGTLNAYYSAVELLVNGSQVGVNHADGVELNSGGDSTQTFGATDDSWGADLTGADLRHLAVRIQVTQDAVAAAGAHVDHVQVEVTHRPPGTQLSLPQGATVIGVDPLQPNVVYLRAPEIANEPSSINSPRILWKLTIAYDVLTDRPVGTLEVATTGMKHIEAACFSAGGICCFGDTVSGVAKIGKLITSNQIIDIGFNTRQQGYKEAWGVTNCWPTEGGVVFDAELEDQTVEQTWFWDASNNAISPIGKRETINSATVLRYHAAQVGAELRRRYRWIPNSTNTDVSRQFQPRNIYQNPLYNDTAEVKEDGVLWARSVEMDVGGPAEKNKSLLTAWCLSRDVSASSTIRLRYSIDGGGTWSTWTTFTSFASKSALATPVAARTVIFEIGLDHTASSADTPNGFMILIESSADWRPLRRWQLIQDVADEHLWEEYPQGPEDLMADLISQQNTLGSQALSIGGAVVAKLAGWKGYDATYIPPEAYGDAEEPDGNFEAVGTLTFVEDAQ